MVLGRRRWAWLLPLPTDWQLEGCGSDGLHFPTTSGRKDVSWPPGEYCSDSSCSSDFSESNTRDADVNSESGFEMRVRRDSEGMVAPSTLPWHRYQSEPNLSRREHAGEGAGR